METQEKNQRERTAILLDRARELMNDAGLHWLQGNYNGEKKDVEGLCFCAMGALYHIESLDGIYESRHAAKILSDLILSSGFDPTEDAVGYHGELMEPWNPKGSMFKNLDAHDVVVRWNDTKGRTWKEVSDLFEKAASSLRG